MKKILVALILFVSSLAYAEEAKVFTDSDLSGYGARTEPRLELSREDRLKLCDIAEAAAKSSLNDPYSCIIEKCTYFRDDSGEDVFTIHFSAKNLMGGRRPGFFMMRFEDGKIVSSHLY